MQSIDLELKSLLDEEFERQQRTLSMIASENIVSEDVLDAMGACVVNKTVEGFPGHRFHAGASVADAIENLAVERARRLFGASYANVQPHSGTQANQAALGALAKPGDRILSMSLADGGHLSHGAKFNFSGTFYQPHHYGVDETTERIDLDAVRRLARSVQPAVIIAGGSSYPRDIDYGALASIAQEVGARLLVDIAHFAGLVANGLMNDPVPVADVVTMSTYKGLRGPRGGLIVSKDAALAKQLQRGLFPFSQGTPAMNMLAAKAVCFHEAQQPAFADYGRRVLHSSARLSAALLQRGLSLVAGGTDSSMVLVNLKARAVNGDQVTRRLEQVGLLANRNLIPNDRRGPGETSGVRLSTSGIMSRGLPVESVDVLAEVIAAAAADEMSEDVARTCRRQVESLCRRWPLSARGARARAVALATSA